MKVVFMVNYERVIKDCFWDLNFSKNDIVEIVKGEDIKSKAFLFDKILQNSTRLLVDIEVFEKRDLELLLNQYKIPSFNYDYIFRKKNIVEFCIFGKPLLIEELKWAI